MVKGLDLFRDHFSEFSDHYILIGGAACDLAMDEAGLEFRATRDLDIVLCAEVLNADFGRAFWDFITQGEYQQQEKSSGEKQFYRFVRPATEGYPVMLELFSRLPEAIHVPDGCTLTPIPIDEEVSSLSAILLDETYYSWIQSGKVEIDGVPMASPECIVPLKARAWLDLTARKSAGEPIDSRSIKKHKNDIFRISQILDPDAIAEAPDAIKEDLNKFIAGMDGESIDLRALGIRGQQVNDIYDNLRSMYALG